MVRSESIYCNQQNVGVNRPLTYTRGVGKSSAPSFMPVEELSATVGVAAYGDASIFQDANRDGAEQDKAPRPFGGEGPFKAPSQLFANIVEEGQAPGERRATGGSRRYSPAILTQAITFDPDRKPAFHRVELGFSQNSFIEVLQLFQELRKLIGPQIVP